MPYIHLLIPQDSEFKPTPAQVGAFFREMGNLGASPSPGQCLVIKPTGCTREVTDPFTRQPMQMPVRDRVEVADAGRFADVLDGLGEYEALVAGDAPPRLALLRLFDPQSLEDVTESCSVNIAAILHPRPSRVLRENSEDQPHPAPDQGHRTTNPWNGTSIEIPGVALSRFRIEFEFGKFVFPKIEGHFNILDERVLSATEQACPVRFVQAGQYVPD